MATKKRDRWIARASHVLLTSIVVSIVFMKKTQLQENLYNGNLYQVAAYLTLGIISTILYFITSFLDPGYVYYNTIDPENGVIFNTKEDQAEILATNDQLDSTESSCMLNTAHDARSIRLRRCGFCELMQPLRAKHCNECQHCVRRYDHHCPWIGNCVGERNHKFFLSFLFSETLLVTWTVYVTVKAFHHDEEWKMWLEKNWVFLILTVFLSCSLLVVGLLWICHSYMMFTAQTTWEFMSRPRISYLKKFPDDYNPFHQGYLWNILSFLCYFRITNWDDVYHSAT